MSSIYYSHSRRSGSLFIAGLLAIALGLLCLVATLALGGCGARVKHVTDLPTGVTEKQVQDWDAAVGNLHKIAAVNSTLRKAVIALNNAGLYGDSAAYVATLRGIAKIDQIQIDGANFLAQQPKAFGEPQKARIRDLMQQIAAEVNGLNSRGIIGVKNPDSKKQVSQLVDEIMGLMNLTLSFTN